MKRKFGRFLLMSLFLVSLVVMPLLVAAPVMADVTYNYTGNQYNYFSSAPPDASLGTNLTASFTFNSSVVTAGYTGYENFKATANDPLTNNITSWSVTSGSITLLSQPSDPEAEAYGKFHFTNGTIDNWYFAVGVNPGYYLMSYNPPGSGASVFDMGNDYYVKDPNVRTWNAVYNNPGMWTKEGPSPVPIPAAVWLFGSGLMGVMGLKRKYLA